MSEQIKYFLLEAFIVKELFFLSQIEVLLNLNSGFVDFRLKVLKSTS